METNSNSTFVSRFLLYFSVVSVALSMWINPIFLLGTFPNSTNDLLQLIHVSMSVSGVPPQCFWSCLLWLLVTFFKIKWIIIYWSVLGCGWLLRLTDNICRQHSLYEKGFLGMPLCIYKPTTDFFFKLLLVSTFIFLGYLLCYYLGQDHSSEHVCQCMWRDAISGHVHASVYLAVWCGCSDWSENFICSPPV